jgi:hypothetical protein
MTCNRNCKYFYNGLFRPRCRFIGSVVVVGSNCSLSDKDIKEQIAHNHRIVKEFNATIHFLRRELNSRNKQEKI